MLARAEAAERRADRADRRPAPPGTKQRGQQTGSVTAPEHLEGIFLVVGQDYVPEMVHIRLPTAVPVHVAINAVNAGRIPDARLRLPRVTAVNPQPVLGIGILLATPLWDLPGAALIDKSSSELSLVLQGDVAGQIHLLTLEECLRRIQERHLADLATEEELLDEDPEVYWCLQVFFGLRSEVFWRRGRCSAVRLSSWSFQTLCRSYISPEQRSKGIEEHRKLSDSFGGAILSDAPGGTTSISGKASVMLPSGFDRQVSEELGLGDLCHKVSSRRHAGSDMPGALPSPRQSLDGDSRGSFRLERLSGRRTTLVNLDDIPEAMAHLQDAASDVSSPSGRGDEGQDEVVPEVSFVHLCVQAPAAPRCLARPPRYRRLEGDGSEATDDAPPTAKASAKPQGRPKPKTQPKRSGSPNRRVIAKEAELGNLTRRPSNRASLSPPRRVTVPLVVATKPSKCKPSFGEGYAAGRRSASFGRSPSSAHKSPRKESSSKGAQRPSRYRGTAPEPGGEEARLLSEIASLNVLLEELQQRFHSVFQSPELTSLIAAASLKSGHGAGPSLQLPAGALDGGAKQWEVEGKKCGFDTWREFLPRLQATEREEQHEDLDDAQRVTILCNIVPDIAEHRVVRYGIRHLREELAPEGSELPALPRRPNGTSRLLQRSFFERLLSEQIELQSSLPSDVAAAQPDLKLLGLEHLLTIRDGCSDFNTDSKSYEVHQAFLEQLERRLQELLAERHLDPQEVMAVSKLKLPIGRMTVLAKGVAALLTGQAQDVARRYATAPGMNILVLITVTAIAITKNHCCQQHPHFVNILNSVSNRA
ncbi:unnamed protein product [Symbiodinium sp. CCMP2592]|nr:unnamed protein product [Symbiodinium sp. CCMP2592]